MTGGKIQQTVLAEYKFCMLKMLDWKKASKGMKEKSKTCQNNRPTGSLMNLPAPREYNPVANLTAEKNSRCHKTNSPPTELTPHRL